MFLSDRDIKWAIENGDLIVRGDKPKIDPTSIDLRLDRADEAKVWDIEKHKGEHEIEGNPSPELRIGKFKYVDFAHKYLGEVPTNQNAKVYRQGKQVIVRQGGFLLWQTKEVVGTPDERANLICFVNGKSTRARTGILAHFTAPTIHAAWSGNIVLEIANLGPFDFVLEEDDVIAQLAIARITSSPQKSHVEADTSTYRQTTVEGLHQVQASLAMPE